MEAVGVLESPLTNTIPSSGITEFPWRTTYENTFKETKGPVEKPREADSSTLSETIESGAKAKLDSLMERTLAEIKRYQDYEDCWDGYRAKVFSHEVLLATELSLYKIESFFQEILYAPGDLFSGPASDGSIDIEIECGPKLMVITHFYIRGKGVADVEVEIKGGNQYRSFKKVDMETGLNWLVNPL